MGPRAFQDLRSPSPIMAPVAVDDRGYSQAPQAQNTWCMRQLVYIENCMGKSPIVK